MYGLDSTHPLDVKALRSAGVSAVGRYVGPFRKGAKPDEIAAYRRAGIHTWFCWETTATRSLSGYAAGRFDGQRARSAMRLLGVPDSIPVIWTVDTDVRGYGDVAEYDRGFHEGAGASAPYGEASVIDGSVAAGRSISGWQTNAAGWTPGRKTSPHASIRQAIPINFPGGAVDPNTVDETSPLLYRVGAHPVVPHPQPYKPVPWPGFMRLGLVADRVAVLKLVLIGAGYGAGLNVKGRSARVFGVGTRRAVMRAQADYYRNAGIAGKPDGLPGTKTWGWLTDRIRVIHHAG